MLTQTQLKSRQTDSTLPSHMHSLPVDSRPGSDIGAPQSGNQIAAMANMSQLRARTPLSQTVPTLQPGGRATAVNSMIQMRAETPFGLSGNAPGDQLEQQANFIADQVMRMPEQTGSDCSCGGSDKTCAACAQIETSIQRKPDDESSTTSVTPPSAAKSLLLQNLTSAGRPLDSATRSFFEPRFERDFGDIRIHTDAEAANLSRGLSAKAFTIGKHIVFGNRHYQPDTSAGRHLLAHELAHTIQQSQGVGDSHIQRQPDARKISITPEWATSLTDDELKQQIQLLREQIVSLDTNDPLLEAAQSNLLILQTESFRRPLNTKIPVSGVGLLPRPAGLSQDKGYTLVEIPDVPQEIIATLPEGQLVDSLPTMPETRPATNVSLPGGTALTMPDSTTSGGFVMPALEIGGGTSASVLTQTARSLRTQGFAAGGQNTIGLVSFPQSGTPGHRILQSRLSWGHTAVYARIDGRIQILRSHAPTSLLGTLATDVSSGGGVKTGRVGVPGSFYGQSYMPGRGIPMFTHTGARSIEFPVSRAVALAAAEGLPDIGPSNLLYTGNPAAQSLCQGMNCVRLAVPVAEEALGGRFGPLTPQGVSTSITDLGPKLTPGGAPDVSSQGRMYAWMGEAGRRGQSTIGWDNRTGTRVIATIADDGQVIVNALPKQAAAPPTVGQMSRGMQYLRWGGRVFFVVGIVTGGAEIAMADPGQRTRVTAEVAGGFAGGWLGGMAGGAAGGAAAGLVCGPGAPVCSTVLAIGGAIIGGIAGGLGGRSLVSALFESLGYDQAAYRDSVNSFMAMLKDKTQGYFVIEANGQMRWISPDPRYSEYAGAIKRFESGESGGCQTCHDINVAWGKTAEHWGSPTPQDSLFDLQSASNMIESDWWKQDSPKQDTLTAQELSLIQTYIDSLPASKQTNP